MCVFQIEFLVDETWKKASEINRESIDDFECSSSKHIMGKIFKITQNYFETTFYSISICFFVGYKRENEQIKYLVKGIKPHDTKIISSGVLSHFRPELIIHFLQDHIDWTRITFDSASFDGKRISCVRPGPCKPERIVCKYLYCFRQFLYFQRRNNYILTLRSHRCHKGHRNPHIFHWNRRRPIEIYWCWNLWKQMARNHHQLSRKFSELNRLNGIPIWQNKQ